MMRSALSHETLGATNSKASEMGNRGVVTLDSM